MQVPTVYTWFPTVSILFPVICMLFVIGLPPKFAKLSKISWKICKFWKRISVDRIHSGGEGNNNHSNYLIHSQHTNISTLNNIHVHKETMGLEGGVYLYHEMNPPPIWGHSLVVFKGWSQILLSTKLFRHGFELFRHGDAKVGGKGTATRWGCRIKQNWLQEPIEGTWQSSKCLHWFATPMPAASCAQLPFEGVILLRESKITPPNFWGTNLKFLT